MRVFTRAKLHLKARLISIVYPLTICMVMCTSLLNPQKALADVVVHVPADWIDMGLGTGTIYDVPPYFTIDDLPESRLIFPDSKYLSLYGFRAYVPAKKCPHWNRAQFSIDYSEIPAEGNGLANFAQNFTKISFVPGNHGNVNITSDRQVVINQARTHRIDLQVRSFTPHFCGTHFLNATFIEVNPQIVFIAFHDIGVPDAVSDKLVEQIIHTLRPLGATVIHDKPGTGYPLISPGQSPNTHTGPTEPSVISPRHPHRLPHPRPTHRRPSYPLSHQ